MRRGAATAADSITQRIGRRIADQNGFAFAADVRGSKQNVGPSTSNHWQQRWHYPLKGS